jgi:transposase
MWTAQSRALVGDFGAGQEALSDEQYALLAPLIPPAKPGGRPRTTDMRRRLDGACSTSSARVARGATCRRPRRSHPGGRSTATCARSRTRAYGGACVTGSC